MPIPVSITWILTASAPLRQSRTKPTLIRTLPFSVDKMVVDDWNQCQQSQYGQFAGLIQAGKLRSEHIYGEIGEVVAGLKPGRESQQERILFWHKGFAVSDIMLGHLAYQKALAKGIGTTLSYYRDPRDM